MYGFNISLHISQKIINWKIDLSYPECTTKRQRENKGHVEQSKKTNIYQDSFIWKKEEGPDIII